MKEFFETLGKKPDLAMLNEEDNRRALEVGAVGKLFLSTKISKTLTKELTKLAGNIGSEIKIISTETEEGDQFYNMGGIGSILRFRV